MKKLTLFIAGLLGMAVLVPAFALAQTGVGATVNTNANVQATGVSATANASTSVTLTAAETKAVAKADQEIERRISALNDLNTRISQMQAVSDTFKQTLNTNIASQVSALNTLKATVDADTTLAALKTDVQSVTKSYRIYVLVIPQGRISAAADRMATIINMMGTVGTKLQARIQVAEQAGNDVTALKTTLADLSAQLSDAQKQAQAAITHVGNLTPDNGVAAQMKANTAALKLGRADIVAGTKDLTTARKDIATVIASLGTLSANASASSTTQTTTQTTTP